LKKQSGNAQKKGKGAMFGGKMRQTNPWQASHLLKARGVEWNMPGVRIVTQTGQNIAN